MWASLSNATLHGAYSAWEQQHQHQQQCMGALAKLAVSQSSAVTHTLRALRTTPTPTRRLVHQLHHSPANQASKEMAKQPVGQPIQAGISCESYNDEQQTRMTCMN
jgi:hypothetical protein